MWAGPARGRSAGHGRKFCHRQGWKLLKTGRDETVKELFSFKQAGVPRWLTPPPPGRLGGWGGVRLTISVRCRDGLSRVLLRGEDRRCSEERDASSRKHSPCASLSRSRVFLKSHSDERGAKGPKTSLTGCSSLAFPEVEATLL